MRYVVQTATEFLSSDNREAKPAMTLINKVTVPCQSADEAKEIADGFNTIPGRRAWAGIEHYTTGGVKIVLSFDDVHDIARAAKELGNYSTDRLAAY